MFATAVTGARARFYEEAPAAAPPPTLEQLERELEVLQGKLRSLTLAQHRIERAAENLQAAIAETRRRQEPPRRFEPEPQPLRPSF
jgi:chromosome segregation ATPase